MSASSFTQLRVWQEARVLARLTYNLTEPYPPKELYALVSQMRRAAVSVMSNIAEGQGRFSRKDFIHFLHMARGSLMELKSCSYISYDLGYISEEAHKEFEGKCDTVGLMLNGLIASMARRVSRTSSSTN